MYEREGNYPILRSSTGIDVLLVQGEIDHHEGVGRLERTFAELIGRGANKIIVDLSDCSYCCSGGIAVFLGANDELKDSGGVLVCSSATGAAKEPMELLDIPDIIPFFDTTAQALTAFENDTIEPENLI